MNRTEAAAMLELRQTIWPNTAVVPDAMAEITLWADELHRFPVGLVESVLKSEDGKYALTVLEVKARCQARMPRSSLALPAPPAGVELERAKRWMRTIDACPDDLRSAVMHATTAAILNGSDPLEAAEAALEMSA